ncbi:hypothetical protein [Variovorax sp. CY25R-8]|uniref:hypothetical protein n=1 Tax=Variovorax sp. CY25R-8 TaxID=2855501 RepID=UPI0021BB6600|nr:hypothetical protein [Variovorax sp. CY25R-8]MCT8179431.1 hypothetical protein [Variovorax sp. CY25R-8]
MTDVNVLYQIWFATAMEKAKSILYADKRQHCLRFALAGHWSQRDQRAELWLIPAITILLGLVATSGVNAFRR